MPLGHAYPSPGVGVGFGRGLSTLDGRAREEGGGDRAKAYARALEAQIAEKEAVKRAEKAGQLRASRDRLRPGEMIGGPGPMPGYGSPQDLRLDPRRAQGPMGVPAYAAYGPGPGVQPGGGSPKPHVSQVIRASPRTGMVNNIVCTLLSI